MQFIKLIEGDVRLGLQTLEKESVDCVVTSPPYWALRDYKIPPSVWDGDPNCEHEWVSENFKQHSGRGDCQKSAKYSDQESIPDMVLKRQYCSKCGAWLGCLGLEVDFNLYVKHLVDIFDGVKRVLKKTGSLWVNLGSTFCSKDTFVVEEEYYATP